MSEKIALKRRQWLLASLAAPCFAGCGDGLSRREVWVSAEGSTASEFGAAWVDVDGRVSRLPVGFRGHDVVPHPLHPDRVVLVARRPGTRLVEVDLLEHRVVRAVECARNHEFGGHACFAADGKVLFSAESDYEVGEGRIVVRDAIDYRPLDEYPSHGIGPHELALMPDERTLVIANGGLLTHPNTGDDVLNLVTMDSRLTFLDARNGELLGEVRVSESKASIRHLDVSDSGEVALALQMQREGAGHDELAPLAAVYDERNGLRVLEAPETLLVQCDDYMGSTRINSTTRIAAFTSPRGDLALFWNLDTLELAGYHTFQDVCGVAVDLREREFILSNSAGQIRRLDGRRLELLAEQLELDGFAWDNHLRSIELSA